MSDKQTAAAQEGPAVAEPNADLMKRIVDRLHDELLLYGIGIVVVIAGLTVTSASVGGENLRFFGLLIAGVAIAVMAFRLAAQVLATRPSGADISLRQPSQATMSSTPQPPPSTVSHPFPKSATVRQPVTGSVASLKRQALEHRLGVLFDDYAAAMNQLNTELGSAQKNTIARQAKDIEEEMQRVEAELASL